MLEISLHLRGDSLRWSSGPKQKALDGPLKPLHASVSSRRVPSVLRGNLLCRGALFPCWQHERRPSMHGPRLCPHCWESSGTIVKAN